MIEVWIFNAIENLQYLLYPIFIIPLFGGNLLFDISYGKYSLLMSMFYGIVFGLTFYFEKKHAQIVS